MTMQTISGHRASQHAEEFEPFLQLLASNNVQSYLEIGARHGDTFYDVMQTLGCGAFGVAVDLPGGPWGVNSSKAALERCIDRLEGQAFNVQAVFGNSQTFSTRDMIVQHGTRAGLGSPPVFDAILIDGDHTYEGVLADWLAYKTFAGRFVAFHDIAGEGVVQRSTGHKVEVPRLWRELKDAFSGTYRFHEFIAPDKPNPMGIGVIDLWG